jgi:tRNA(Ile)-lysidine synthase
VLTIEKTFITALKSFNIAEKQPLAVACSGGADSMALTLLAQHWAKANGTTITAITVDHGLRAQSASEAKQVAVWLKKAGIPHVILKWIGKKPARNIQESARNARYHLLSDYCKQHGIAHLLVAHHREDQAETFLLRLARGSGVDGLAAMNRVTTMHGITLVRPLLDVSKQELISYLKTRKQAYVNDPSNHDTQYDRVKIRKLLPTLAAAGLTPERLAKTATIMARARAHLEEETGKFLSRHCKIFAEGYAHLSSIHPSEEIALRALATLIMLIGGHEVRTRLSDLERLHSTLQKKDFKGATLGGCIFSRHKNHMLICREPSAVAKPVKLHVGTSVMWDNRFEVSLHTSDSPLFVGALTQEGWLFCAHNYKLKNPHPDKKILYTLPALRDASGWLFAVPHLGLAAPGTQCAVIFNTPV